MDKSLEDIFNKKKIFSKNYMYEGYQILMFYNIYMIDI